MTRGAPWQRLTKLAMLVVAPLPATVLARPASAQEYCISCSGPETIYRCIIDGARPGGRQPLQMLCVTTMAKQGGHASCSVKSGTVFDCNGSVRHIPFEAAQGDQVPPVQTAPTGAPAKPTTGPAGEPRTIVDMAKRANKATEEQIQEAGDDVKTSVKSTGDAIKGAAKKTWSCVTSLFFKC
ncbi:MAG: hypothetical protein AB7K67_00275 [Hyphomicrobiaceae bacterium]